MIHHDPEHLLFIEPTSAPAVQPVIDDLTRKMAGAWRARETSRTGARGWHNCTGAGCSANSDNHDHWVTTADGARLSTNWLCVHYLAFHRGDVPPEEIAKIERLAGDPVEPNDDELGIVREPPPRQRMTR